MSIRALPRRTSLRAVTIQDVRVALADATTDTAPNHVLELIEREAAPLRTRVLECEIESSTAHANVRRMSHMQAQTEQLAAHQQQQLIRATTTAAHATEMLRRVKEAAQASFNGTLPAEDVLALLAEEIVIPELFEAPVGFWPDDRFRAGVFTSHDHAVQVTYSFIGWTNVARAVGGPLVTQPTFIVPDRGACAQRTIEIEKNLTLQFPLLPPVLAAA